MSNHLRPCPFCGGDASFNEHTDGCYFTVLRKLKADPPADLSRVPDLIEAWNTRTAIQQAEAQQPATPEPVAWRYQPEDGLKFPGFTQYEAVAVSRGKPGTVLPLYTHPAPGVQDDVVRDAERYRWLRDNPIWLGWEHDFRQDEVDAQVDAAMLASPAQKGGE